MCASQDVRETENWKITMVLFLGAYEYAAPSKKPAKKVDFGRKKKFDVSSQKTRLARLV